MLVKSLLNALVTFTMEKEEKLAEENKFSAALLPAGVKKLCGCCLVNIPAHTMQLLNQSERKIYIAFTYNRCLYGKQTCIS